jgi:pimeloyl-ACP methyl ester carboxylesterase
MKILTQAPSESSIASSVIALHCSLGSGHQWSRLAEELTGKHQVITPDISGYGSNDVGRFLLPTTMAEEVDLLSDRLGEAVGPIHLVGHSYGGALAFKIATDSPLAGRVRSLTLIEPVLPTILMESESDRRLYEQFVCLAQVVCKDLRVVFGGSRKIPRILERIRAHRATFVESTRAYDRACGKTCL